MFLLFYELNWFSFRRPKQLTGRFLRFILLPKVNFVSNKTVVSQIADIRSVDLMGLTNYGLKNKDSKFIYFLINKLSENMAGQFQVGLNALKHFQSLAENSLIPQKETKTNWDR